VESFAEGDLVVRPLLAGTPRLLPDVVIRPRVYLIMPVSCCLRTDVRVDLGEKTSVGDEARKTDEMGSVIMSRRTPGMACAGVCAINCQGSLGAPGMLHYSTSRSAFPGNTPTSMYRN
jgi:hypothetical protein